MKISLHWLKDFLPTGLPDAPAVADALTAAGFPIESIETHGDDTVIDVEVTSNRGDCLSHAGVARELSAILQIPLHLDPHSAPEGSDAASAAVSVRIDAPQLCPHYTARLIRGVKIGPSPAWMAQRLEAVGVRPINNVVDVTNYVMLEMGQPLHAFDFAKIAGGQIVVRSAARGESITSIDGRKRELAGSMLVIADAQKPVALAGVMGGLESEVTEKTTDVLLESARFDALCVRRTARALAMKSESSYRFERGIDPSLPARASLRARSSSCKPLADNSPKGWSRPGPIGPKREKSPCAFRSSNESSASSFPPIPSLPPSIASVLRRCWQTIASRQ